MKKKGNPDWSFGSGSSRLERMKRKMERSSVPALLSASESQCGKRAFIERVEKSRTCRKCGLYHAV